MSVNSASTNYRLGHIETARAEFESAYPNFNGDVLANLRTREYGRLFGLPPVSDTKATRQLAQVAA